jgi:hypothetical protein
MKVKMTNSLIKKEIKKQERPELFKTDAEIPILFNHLLKVQLTEKADKIVNESKSESENEKKSTRQGPVRARKRTRPKNLFLMVTVDWYAIATSSS